MSPSAAESADRVLCHCYRVTECAIRDSIQAGAATVDEIRSQTFAGGGCTACQCRIRRLLTESSSRSPALA